MVIKIPSRKQISEMDYKGEILPEFEAWRKEYKAHFCYEWDDALVYKGIPEFKACLCFKKEDKK